MAYNILITGGAGYLGSTMVPAMLEAGHKVTVLDNFMFKQNTLGQNCLNPNFDVYRGDARDKNTLAPLIKSADIVIPLAAIVGAPMCDADQIAATSTNRDSIITLTEMLSADQRIITPITNSGYGIGEAGKVCTEESPLNPISLYGTTKVEAERAVLDRGNAISFRLATVFGMSPRMRLDLLVNDFVYRAIHDRAVVLFESHFKRNYIHVRDIARVFLHGIDNFETMKDQPYNVGLSDANLSKAELCDTIKKHISNFVYLDAPIGEDPDKRDYIVSNDRVEATGYMPKYSLDDGIVELIKGYRMIRNSVYGNV
jgi:nucleoside-diphosphate-sugar epimerase